MPAVHGLVHKPMCTIVLRHTAAACARVVLDGRISWLSGIRVLAARCAALSRLALAYAERSALRNTAQQHQRPRNVARCVQTGGSIGLFSMITIVSFFILAPIALLVEGFKLSTGAMTAMGIPNATTVLQRATGAALMFHLYQQVSYMILSRVSPVSHAIGNCVKRCASADWDLAMRPHACVCVCAGSARGVGVVHAGAHAEPAVVAWLIRSGATVALHSNAWMFHATGCAYNPTACCSRMRHGCRVVVIVSAVIFFGNPMSTQSKLSTGVALLGVFAYSQVKRLRKPKGE